MKIVILGGTGLIGSKVVNLLRAGGHEVVAASPSQGINSITGGGLTEALTGAQVVVDVTNAPSWEDKAVLEFFETSTHNVLAAEAKTGASHHIALSIVGCDQLPASGYLRAKVAQEKLIKASPIPYTIVRATQFFEFVGGIADSATNEQTVRLPSALFQPILSDDAVTALAKIAVAKPLNWRAPRLFPLTRSSANTSLHTTIPAKSSPTSKPTTSARRSRSAAWFQKVRTRYSVPPVSRTGLAAPLHGTEPLIKKQTSITKNHEHCGPIQKSAYKKDNTMKRSQTSKPVRLLRFIYALVACTLIDATVGAGAAIAADESSKVTLVYEHALPNLPGKSIKGVLVEYGPGGSSSAHMHAKSAFIYATVLEGTIRSSVNDGPVVTYRTGESFSEMPGDRHAVSENASKTEPAKLLAVFVVDTDEKELTTPYEK